MQMTFKFMPFTEHLTAVRSRSLAVCAALMTAVAAWGLDVVCTPGSLSGAVSSPAAVTELRLSGSVDAADLFFIAAEMPALRSLDLSQVTVAQYSGSPLRRRTTYPAATIPANAFAGAGITSLSLPAAVNLEGGAFAGTAITSLAVPSGVTFSGPGAFSSCNDLTEVTLHSAAAGEYAFAGCNKLAKVTFAGTAALDGGAFEGCPALRDVQGTSALTSIGARAFDGCPALADFAFGPNLTEIGDRAFAGTALTVADLAPCSRLRSIGAWAFADCASLTSVQLPAGLAAVGKGTFFGCTALTSANFPAATMDDYVFKGAPLTDSGNIVADGVAKIGDYALKDSRIADLALPNSLDSIGTGAMEGMTALTDIHAETFDHVPALGDDVWQGVDQRAVTLHLEPGVASEFSATPQWKDFHIEVMSTDTPIIDIAGNGVRGRFDGTTLLVHSQGADMTSVSLYDTAGTLLTVVTAGAAEASVDTSAFSANIYIVAVELAGGSRAVLKMLR